MSIKLKPFLKEKYKVKEVGVFGSYVKNKQKKKKWPWYTGRIWGSSVFDWIHWDGKFSFRQTQNKGWPCHKKGFKTSYW